MVLDHGGPDLAMILYGGALKLWLFGALIVGFLIPRAGLPVVDMALAVAGMLALAVVLGVIESTMARLRMVRVPELLVGALTLAALALVLEFGGALA
jgi:formate hydrogenlyase subunit 4